MVKSPKDYIFSHVCWSSQRSISQTNKSSSFLTIITLKIMRICAFASKKNALAIEKKINPIILKIPTISQIFGITIPMVLQARKKYETLQTIFV